MTRQNNETDHRSGIESFDNGSAADTGDVGKRTRTMRLGAVVQRKAQGSGSWATPRRSDDLDDPFTMHVGETARPLPLSRATRG